MRVLKFIVDGQVIKPHPSCDFSGLVPGSMGQIQAEFTFSKEWLNTQKVAGFYSRLGNEYPPQLLKNGKTCIIPTEALEKQFFKIKIMGQNGLVTNKLTVEQKGG